MSTARHTLGRSLLACVVAALGACKGSHQHQNQQLTAPAITAQPQGQSVLPGETATFTVQATGSAPLSYQWSKNGTDIPGATSASYTTPAAAAADDGAAFRVKVSNDAGSVTSNPANLVLIAPYWVYRNGVVADGWGPGIWNGGCQPSNPNMQASFGGQTVASFDLSCGGWNAGTFGNWSTSSGFDLSPYDTLSFDIASVTAADKLVIWAQEVNNGPDYRIPIPALTAGQFTHVKVRLADLGMPGTTVHQLGFMWADGANGPHFYVNNMGLSAQRPTTPPVISALAVTQAGSYTATITWTTDRDSAAVVTAQAEGGGPALVSGERAQATAHSFTIESLQPATLYHVTVVAKDAWGLGSTPAAIDVTTAAAGAVTPDVTVTLDPAHPSAISPWIYGINGLTSDGNPPLLTFDRSGGNRLTAYNWETNASNAGSDYIYSNDNYLSSSTNPGEVSRSMIAADRAAGAASLVTFQLQGYVAADESGAVDMTQDLATRLAARFKQAVPKKSTISSAAFTLTPPTGDAYVYMDEYAWALDQLFPGADIFGASTAVPTFICLDNEPELWNTTHEEVQGSTRITADAYIQKTLAMTAALKDQFPDAKIFGPVHYGFMGLWNWQDDATLGGGTNWFTDKYLKALKAAEDADPQHRRLVDVYDFHWYAEVYDASNNRITVMSSPDLTDAQVQLIVQSPRSLWDATFDDPGDWIHSTIGGSIQLLPRLQAKIDAEYPGTKLAITEYESGGWNHIAGTIAQADNLGIFGVQGVFAANFWPPGGTYDYALAGFRAFRGFDGATASFGDTAVPANSSDVSKVAVYASQDTAAAGRQVFVAINRSTALQKVSLAGAALSGTATLYRMTAATAAAQVNAGAHVAPVPVGTQPVSGTSMLVVLPPLSVTTIDVQ